MKLLRVSEILKDKNISNKDLAIEMQVSQNTISKIVNGNSFPKPELLLRIANYLDVDIRELFEQTKPTEENGDNSFQDLYIKKGDRYMKIGEINI